EIVADAGRTAHVDADERLHFSWCLLLGGVVEPAQIDVRVRARGDEDYLAARLQPLPQVQRPNDVRVIRVVAAAPQNPAGLSQGAAREARLRAEAKVVRAGLRALRERAAIARANPARVLREVLCLAVAGAIVEVH